jgi:predicted O-methyltransferase YrrM
MRNTTWIRLQESPSWRRIYEQYRKLPNGLRRPIRYLAIPHWLLATSLVRCAARNRVIRGPFRGMKLELSPLSKTHHIGYILGTQELELNPLIDTIIARGYRSILNIGAAEGYYAIGLAMRNPGSQVIAYEALSELHPILTRCAHQNRVSDRISIQGRCHIGDLQNSLKRAASPALIFMDIEGGEVALLDPAIVPALTRTDIIVEMHDYLVSNATETVLSRFASTHSITRWTSCPRTIEDFPREFLPVFRKIFPQLCIDLMDERRPAAQQWLYLVAK